jgi:hypothetical protein
MGRPSEKKPLPGETVLFFQVVGAFLGAGGLGVLIARTLWPSDPAQAIGLGFLSGLLGLYLLSKRYGGDWSNQTEEPTEDDIYIHGEWTTVSMENDIYRTAKQRFRKNMPSRFTPQRSRKRWSGK